MPTRAIAYDDRGPDALDASAFRGLAGQSVWDDGLVLYHLEYSDFDRNRANDWDEDGARVAIERAFAAWSDVADLTFVPTSRANANMIERISDADGGTNLGFHYLPGGNSDTGRRPGDPNDTGLRTGEQSDGEFNHDGRGWNGAGLQEGGYGYVTVVHEVGHGLGLEHPFDDDLFAGVGGPFQPGWFDLNQGVYTVMAYADGWALRGGSPSDGYGLQRGPMALDVAAIQAIYGANEAFARGDDEYGLSDANAPGTFYSTLWDAGGRDAITYEGGRDARVFLGEATIDDSATAGGLISYVEGIEGGYTIARGAVIEDARTGSGADLIAGNAAGNALRAGAGADTVFGMEGDDLIEGGAGGDLLVGDYVSVTEFGSALPEAGEGPALPDGLNAGDGAATAARSSSNGSRAQAIDLSDEFALSVGDARVLGGEAVHNVTVTAAGGGELDYYRLDLDERSLVVADVDGASMGFGASAFDSVLAIADANGRELAFGDDSLLSQGGTGSAQDYDGFPATFDSYLAVVLDPGTYYIVVAEWADPSVVEEGFQEITAGGTYTLEVSADGNVPESLPEDALGQLAYYYEQPDYGDVAQAAFGGLNAPGASSRASKEGGGHDHGRGEGHEHGLGCGCPGCSDADGRAEGDAATDTALFAFEAEPEALFAQGDALIA